jgi:thioredoxin-like negative regulator of GroEL
MKPRPRVCIAMLAALSGPVTAEEAGAGPFLVDSRAAHREARARDRPLLIDFQTSWCRACEVMQRTTWRDAGVQALLSRFVALSVDGERNLNLAQRYDVQAYPTIVIAEPGGEPILVLIGLQDPPSMRDHLTRVTEEWNEVRAWAVEASLRRPTPGALAGLADFARARGAWAQAEALYRRAMRHEKSLPAEQSLETRAGLAEVLAATGRCREALKVLGKATPGNTDEWTARMVELRDGVDERCGD